MRGAEEEDSSRVGGWVQQLENTDSQDFSSVVGRNSHSWA